MDNNIINVVNDLYNLNIKQIKLIQDAENKTFKLISDKNNYLLKLYRIKSKQNCLNEIEWVNELCKFINIPKIIQDKNGNLLNSFLNLNFTISEYINSKEIEINKENLFKMGGLLKDLHYFSKIIVKNSKNQKLFNVQKYDIDFIINNSNIKLENADFISKTDKKKLFKISEKLLRGSKKFNFNTFIHSDFFHGNVLVSEKELYCIDFDECGFGNVFYDLGTIRCHLLKLENHEDLYESFLNGYGLKFKKYIDELNIGTSLRLFYMLGKLSQRLDLDFIAKNPNSYVKRYLKYFKILN